MPDDCPIKACSEVGVDGRQIRICHGLVYKEGMDQWLLAVTSDPAAKGSAKDLEVAGAGPVHCHFSLPPFLPYHV